MKLLIHIGYPKTASTFLQTVIFNNEENGFVSPWGTQAAIAIEEFVLTNPFLFDPEYTRQKLMPDIHKAEKEGLIPVLSNEGLVSLNIHSYKNYMADCIANRINQAFPDAKILIMIREQKSMIYSAYKEHIKGNGIVRFVEVRSI
ncbi:MAG: hypothetical protein EA365_00325 [Gloeocapsa sp. DLM2.Bin57]|nr:MAG: hypothetical protein EA365_00325 [Gloeocapsa sp. DLM2.Bin57]